MVKRPSQGFLKCKKRGVQSPQNRMTTFWKTLQLLMLCGVIAVSGWAKAPTAQQVSLMAEEESVMQHMRQQLVVLLEQEELERSLLEGEDAFQDFQQLEQWMQSLKEGGSPEQMQQVMELLEAFERQLSELLAQQENLSEFLPHSGREQAPQSQPLSDLMENLRKLLEDGRIPEAQELLNQMLSAFNRQQQEFEQAVAQYLEQQAAELMGQLEEMRQQLQQSQQTERQVQQTLRQSSPSQPMTSEMRQQTGDLQQQISEALRQLQAQLESLSGMSQTSMMQATEQLLRSGEQASEAAERALRQGNRQQSLNSAQQTEGYLNQLLQNMGPLRQMAQQSARKSRRMRGAREHVGGRGYWSERGIRPLKFEYDFQANPKFREDIQRRNQQEGVKLTPRQQRYLKEVIR